jgi:hypothetical protein
MFAAITFAYAAARESAFVTEENDSCAMHAARLR